MNGSTRACISILNAVSLILLFVGFAGVALVVLTAAESSTVAMVINASSLVGTIVVSVLLRSVSEALRLLSAINESVKPSPATEAIRSTRAA